RWIFCFQAEDGIRDRSVTGVQTCALPISTRGWESLFFGGSSSFVQAFFLFPAFRGQVHPQGELPALDAVGDLGVAGHLLQKKLRSEERRVGKACRAGRSRVQWRAEMY